MSSPAKECRVKDVIIKCIYLFVNLDAVTISLNEIPQICVLFRDCENTYTGMFSGALV